VPVSAQIPASDHTDAVRVYFDCEDQGCDRDYMVTEIGFVNWVRDRADADVHLLVTTITTGGGGREYSVNFLGARRFAGVRDSLRYNSAPNESQDASRTGLAKVIKLGLIRFVAGTPEAQRITISYEAPSSTAANAVIRDPWHFWTYSLESEAFGNGEQSYGALYLYGSFSANRITEAWKIQLNLNNSYNVTRFELTDGTFHNYQRSSNASSLVGKSINAHWTAGGFASIGRSDY